MTVKVSDLVKAKMTISIGDSHGIVVGRVRRGEIGIVIGSKEIQRQKQVYVRFNSGETHWLTEDELEIVSQHKLKLDTKS